VCCLTVLKGGGRPATGSDENRQDEAFNGLIITLNKIPGDYHLLNKIPGDYHLLNKIPGDYHLLRQGGHE
jgi:hypothetical protein